MKKRILTLFMLGSALIANAQYLPNYGFSTWKGEGNAGSTYQSSKSGLSGSTNAGLRQRPGDEPQGWFGSSINQKVSGVEKQQVLISKSTKDDATWAKLINSFVGIKIGISEIGSVAPGYLTFGTPWVYAVTTVSKCDGGTYGGMSFSHKPDAIVGKYKKTPTTTSEDSYIIAYIWNGTFTSQIAAASSTDNKQDDVDRAILGSQSETGVTAPANVTASGKLIGYCNYKFQTTADNDWQVIEVPLTYVESNRQEIPSKMNVVICAGDYYNRGNLQDGTVLEVDDVDFVYWNTLSSLKFDNVELLAGESASFIVDAVYDAAKLQAVAKSQFAEVSTSYDETKAQATVTVTRENAETKTYTIQFKYPDYSIKDLAGAIEKAKQAKATKTWIEKIVDLLLGK